MSGDFPPEWSAARKRFIEAGGHTTQSLGFGRILGQTLALLYLSPKPLCLDEIAEELGVSKASVSTTVRQLESWATIKRVWVKGDRKDYYEAQTDLGAVLRNGLIATLRKKLETAGAQLQQVTALLAEAEARADGKGAEEIKVVAARLRKAKQLHEKLDALLSNPLLDKLL